MAFGLSGCRNSCQRVCIELRDYAEECGVTIPDGQFKDCISAQRRGNIRDYLEAQYGEEDAPGVNERLDVCSESLPTLRDDWSCDDVLRYFAEGGEDEIADTGS